MFQHLEYFPFGETFVEEHSNTQRAPYLFTGKELDEDTGLYYYGARHYDPRTSLWQSADPVLAKYLPSAGEEAGPTDDIKISLPSLANNYGSPRHALPGIGGVFTGKNLSLYAYTQQNPVRYRDPDGNMADDAVVWGIALAEPSPFGEIAAAAYTIGKYSLIAAGVLTVASLPGDTAQTDTKAKAGPTTATSTDTAPPSGDGRRMFYHGTDADSLMSLAGGQTLDPKIAAGLRHSKGAPGFYLATDKDAALYFASRSGSSYGVMGYAISGKAYGALSAAGAVERPVPAGGIQQAGQIPGNELYIPPSAFPVFNEMMGAGEITPVPVP